MGKLIPRVSAGFVVGYSFWCVACRMLHAFNTNQAWQPWWTFDGNMESPTFVPSLRYVDYGCHLFVSNGEISYCNDCRHELRGKIVPMVEWDLERWAPMSTRDEQIKAWIAAGYSPERAAATVDALTPPAAKVLGTAPGTAASPGSGASASQTHKPEAGNVGATGAHGELGSNAKS